MDKAATLADFPIYYLFFLFGHGVSRLKGFFASLRAKGLLRIAAETALLTLWLTIHVNDT